LQRLIAALVSLSPDVLERIAFTESPEFFFGQRGNDSVNALNVPSLVVVRWVVDFVSHLIP
jgi:hypothetical protein